MCCLKSFYLDPQIMKENLRSLKLGNTMKKIIFWKVLTYDYFIEFDKRYKSYNCKSRDNC